MKQYLIFLFLILGSNTLNASENELFTYDRSVVNGQLAEVSKVENFLNAHTSFAIDSITKNGSYLINGIELQSHQFNNDNGSLTSHFPPFMAGCCLGPFGIILCLSEKDKVKKDSVLNGLIVGTVFYLVIIYLFADVIHNINTQGP